MKKSEYNIFADEKNPFVEQYPQLAGVLKEIEFNKLIYPVEIDKFLRYIVYLYDVNSDLNDAMPDVEKRRESALAKLNISQKTHEHSTFRDIELEMANRFMFINCNTAYETWLSGKIRLNAINKEFRRDSEKISMNDANSSITAIEGMVRLEDLVEKLRVKVFGDNLAVEKYTTEKQLINRNYAEGHAE